MGLAWSNVGSKVEADEGFVRDDVDIDGYRVCICTAETGTLYYAPFGDQCILGI